jgi:hypothetical protein
MPQARFTGTEELSTLGDHTGPLEDPLDHFSLTPAGWWQ